MIVVNYPSTSIPIPLLFPYLFLLILEGESIPNHMCLKAEKADLISVNKCIDECFLIEMSEKS